jgi:GNAT superfamily N-acetyltransferase
MLCAMSHPWPDLAFPYLLQCSGRAVTADDVEFIRALILRHPQAGRVELSLLLCREWDWHRADGTWNHRACRELLLRLHGQGKITLPPPHRLPGRLPPTPAWGDWRPGDLAPNFPLHDVIVRPIQFEERRQWHQVMAQYHYLGFQNTVGEAIRYVATVGPHWLALLAWAAAAFKSRHREAWIGWDEALKWRRLHLIANNVRFLILPGIQRKNLASKVLALNLHRLSEDWQHRYGHPILLAETFIDVARFPGTCYRAAGWLPLGETRGFGKRRQGYCHHGHPKTLFVRPLRPDAAQLLAAPFSPPRFPPSSRKENIRMLDVNRLPVDGEGGLMELLRTLTDPRKPRGVRHPLVCIVAIATCACLAGARSFEAMAQWAQELSRDALQRLGGTRPAPPSEKCLRLTLQRLDVVALDRQLGAWLARHNLRPGKAVAVDGKTLRGAHDGPQSAPHLLSALIHQAGIVVAQHPVGDKTNEIPCLQPLLDPLPLQGTVVTADALHTQTETARYLVEDKHADYVFTVKENQPTLRQDIADLQLEAFPPTAHGDHQRPRTPRDP